MQIFNSMYMHIHKNTLLANKHLIGCFRKPTNLIGLSLEMPSLNVPSLFQAKYRTYSHTSTTPKMTIIHFLNSPYSAMESIPAFRHSIQNQTKNPFKRGVASWVPRIHIPYNRRRFFEPILICFFGFPFRQFSKSSEAEDASLQKLPPPNMKDLHIQKCAWNQNVWIELTETETNTSPLKKMPSENYIFQHQCFRCDLFTGG